MARSIRDRGARREYWHDELVRRGFSLHSMQSEWSHYNTDGPFSLSFRDESQFVDPAFGAIDLNILVSSQEMLGWVNTAFTTVLDIDDPDVHHVLDCLVKPELLPTCVGIRWFGNLLQNWMAAQ